jgi:PAS domain S-box-containing protein
MNENYMNENWIIWKSSRQQIGRSVCLRYTIATILPSIAAIFINIRPALAETPHFVFLGAVVLSALYGGVGPALFSASLATLLIQIFFVHPLSILGLMQSPDRLEALGLFLLISLMIGCLVSALRREKNLLHESEQRYRHLAESASDAILVLDDQGQIMFVNPVAEKLFSAQTPHLIGQHIGRFVPNSTYLPYMGAKNLGKLHNTVAFQIPDLRVADKHMLLEMTLRACSQQGQRLYTAIIRDVTGLPRRPVPAPIGIAA